MDGIVCHESIIQDGESNGDKMSDALSSAVS